MINCLGDYLREEHPFFLQEASSDKDAPIPKKRILSSLSAGASKELSDFGGRFEALLDHFGVRGEVSFTDFSE